MKIKQMGIILFIFVMIVSTAFATLPEITQVNYTPSPAVPGTTITVLVQLENKDSTSQTGVKVQLENTYPFTIKPTDTQLNPATVGTIESFGKALVQFTVYVDPAAENKTYYLPVTISTTGNTTGIKEQFPIIVGGKEPTIKVVSTTSEKLLPGQEKEISFTLQNVGTSPAYDVVLEIKEDRTITATGTVVERDITPLGAATAYVSSINPGEQKQVTLKVSVTNTATIKNYTLPVAVSYRNASGTRTTDTSYVGLKVFALVDIDATLKDKTGTVANGQKAEITIEIYNKGLGKAEFTVVEIKTPNGVVDKPKQFIGSLGPNDVDTVKTGITFSTGTDYTIDVVIEYQDSDAVIKTKTIQLPIKADTTTTEGPNMTLILVVLVIVGIIVWKFVLKKKK
ncbi:MAG: CARDB domain-containing protein [archaeon]|jgi:hypothetical protein